MSLRKILTLSVGAFAIATMTLPAQAQQSLQQIYNEGIKLYNAGKYEEALKRFEAYTAKHPAYPYARDYASKCKTMIAKEAKNGKNDLAGQLKELKLPEVNLEETPLGDALTYLSQRAEELSGGKVVPNFIYKGTPEQRSNTLITLRLRNAPISEVLRYIGDLSKTKFVFEKHAIVATPIGGAAIVTQPVSTETPAEEKLKFAPVPNTPDPTFK